MRIPSLTLPLARFAPRSAPLAGALLLAAAIVAGLSLLRAAEPQLLQRATLWAFDSYQRIQPRAFGGAPAVVVDIDNESLARLGQWPWSRARIARLVDRVREAGAAVVAFDIVFAEPDRTAAGPVIASWREALKGAGAKAGALPLDALQVERLARAIDPDARLAEALARTPSVAGFALTGEPVGRLPRRVAGFAWGGSHPAAALRHYRGAVTTLPQLEAAAAGNGDFSIYNDADNIVRRVPLLQSLEGEIYPSLTAEALRLATGAGSYLVRSSDASGQAGGRMTGVTEVKIGPFVVPTTAAGELWLHFRPEAEGDRVAAWRVLDESTPAKQLRHLLAGKIAIVGVSATGLLDIRATPLHVATPGPLIHAQAIEQIVSGAFLVRPDWASGAEWGLMAALALGLAVTLCYLPPLVGAGLGVGALALAVGASWLAFAHHGLLLDPVYPVLAVVATFVAVEVLRHFTVERRRAGLKRAFSQYLAPALVEKLAERPDRLQLGGETREMTILFSDIRGFTTLSEKLRPDLLSQVLNRYLTRMTGVILNAGGTIDKYIGDAVMAFWNAPLDDPDHAASAARAALAMREALAAFNEEEAALARREGREPLRLKIGIGLNSGAAAVGNFGSEQRFTYTALGDAVNLAARIESLTKTCGVDILVSETTAATIPNFALLEVDRVIARGRSQETVLFALAGSPGYAATPRFAELRRCHEALLSAIAAGDWPTAEAALIEARLLAEPTLEGLYRQLGERVARLRREGGNDRVPVTSFETPFQGSSG